MLADSGGDVRVALVRLLGGVDADRARTALEASGGIVRGALDHLVSPTTP
jgi:N-acetylmuramic acid 6-phosphate (MurNAc-6-P) etherase